MVRIAKVDYDEENDILYVSSGKKVMDSLEIDKFVIDFAKGNEVSGIEIFEASKLISDLSQNKLSKEQLSKIEAARLKVVKSKELLYIVILFLGAHKEIRISVPAPMVVVTQNKR